ncbi:hypothetical protein CKO19_17115, partial [Rhodovulum adriaticum]|nr:hypothetical protein [Rhodovulum adriaticum]
ETMSFDQVHDRIDILPTRRRADRDETARRMYAKTVAIENGGRHEFAGKVFRCEIIGGFAPFRIADDWLRRGDEDGFMVPADFSGLRAPDLARLLLGLAEAAGGAGFVQELLLLVEREFVPLQGALGGVALGVADDLAVPFGEFRDRRLGHVQDDDRFLFLIIADADAEIAKVLG